MLTFSQNCIPKNQPTSLNEKSITQPPLTSPAATHSTIIQKSHTIVTATEISAEAMSRDQKR